MAEKAIPTSRVSRSTRLGRVAVGQAVRQAGTRAANLARSDERGAKMLEKRQVEMAEALVDALGTMKGAAMKVGQMLSIIDVGLIPPEYREQFQRKLAKLRDAAPDVPFKKMRKLIEDDLGQKLDQVFSRFDEQPIAAASIGQVYRAQLHDGREVAVKVQYPGVGIAVEADLRNLSVFMRVMKRMAPGLDVKALADEIRERISEELDYELEAQNQRSAARLYRGHPFIYVPKVVTEYSRQHVIVTEFAEGIGFEEIKDTADEATRNRVGEIMFRFYNGSLYRHNQFSPDPHPGNFRLMPDGRVAFLDFGLYKHMDPAKVAMEIELQRFVAAGNAEGVHALLARGGFMPQPERVPVDEAFDYVMAAFWWYTTDEEIELTPEIATEAVFETMDPRSSHYARARHQEMPPEHLFIRRMEFMVLAALGQLHVTNNWYRIASEWVTGAAPQTELGREEAEYLGLAVPA